MNVLKLEMMADRQNSAPRRSERIRRYSIPYGRDSIRSLQSTSAAELLNDEYTIPIARSGQSTSSVIITNASEIAPKNTAQSRISNNFSNEQECRMDSDVQDTTMCSCLICTSSSPSVKNSDDINTTEDSTVPTYTNSASQQDSDTANNTSVPFLPEEYMTMSNNSDDTASEQNSSIVTNIDVSNVILDEVTTVSNNSDGTFSGQISTIVINHDAPEEDTAVSNNSNGTSVGQNLPTTTSSDDPDDTPGDSTASNYLEDAMEQPSSSIINPCISVITGEHKNGSQKNSSSGPCNDSSGSSSRVGWKDWFLNGLLNLSKCKGLFKANSLSSNSIRSSSGPCSGIDFTCLVCLRDYQEIITERSHVVSNRCGHIMCKICANRLIETRGTCPKCRSRMKLKSLTRLFF